MVAYRSVCTENQHTQISTSITTLTTHRSTRGQSSIHSFTGPKKFHPQMQSGPERGNTSSKCWGTTTTLWVLSGVASLITTRPAAIRVPTVLPAPARRQRHLSLFSRMSEASLRKFREYYVTTTLKWVTNLSMFCVHVSRGQRTNPPPCSAEVLFTGSPALIAISCTMDRLTEPWKPHWKNIKARFGLETTTPKLRSTQTSLSIV